MSVWKMLCWLVHCPDACLLHGIKLCIASYHQNIVMAYSHNVTAKSPDMGQSYG